jgi:hypothetical protein
MLFHEAMEEFDGGELEKSFARFERAATKAHEESIWILSVVKDVEMDWNALKEAFAMTNKPLGWVFAGWLAEDDSREEFDFNKKSAEAGCSWGQADYGLYFEDGNAFVEEDKKTYLEWREKAANQNNTWAINWLGMWFQDEGNDKKKAISYYQAAAELGSKFAARLLADIFYGEGCEKDLRQAALWAAKAEADIFWVVLNVARRALETGATEVSGCDLNRLCYTLGWGSYWYVCSIQKDTIAAETGFRNRCLDYYCSCVEMQQKSIFTFLLCWKQMGLSKDVGRMVAKRVWEEREDNLVYLLKQNDGEEPETKRIKK